MNDSSCIPNEKKKHISLTTRRREPCQIEMSSEHRTVLSFSQQKAFLITFSQTIPKLANMSEATVRSLANAAADVGMRMHPLKLNFP